MTGHPLEDRRYERFGARDVPRLQEARRLLQPFLLPPAAPLPRELPAGAVHERLRFEALGAEADRLRAQLRGLVGLPAGQTLLRHQQELGSGRLHGRGRGS